jgi:microcystin-dependent protein
MGTPFLGEIRMTSFNFAPKGWAQCNGQFLPINQNQALFSLLGTQYGGNGQTTFALPDLRGRAPIHWGGSISFPGEQGGQEFHTVTLSEMPAHTHTVPASNLPATLGDPTGTVWGSAVGEARFASVPNGSMAPGAASNVGGSQPHENRQPFAVLQFIIALQGIFPSQS